MQLFVFYADCSHLDIGKNDMLLGPMVDLSLGCFLKIFIYLVCVCACACVHAHLVRQACVASTFTCQAISWALIFVF